jgi:hypothetical protein
MKKIKKNFIESLIDEAKEPDIVLDTGKVEELGALKLFDKSYCITYDVSAIYANREVILYTHNDPWSAIATLDSLLKAIYKTNYVSKL